MTLSKLKLAKTWILEALALGGGVDDDTLRTSLWAIEKVEKYKLHDLIKHPLDYPRGDVNKLIVARKKNGEYIAMRVWAFRECPTLYNAWREVDTFDEEE